MRYLSLPLLLCSPLALAQETSDLSYEAYIDSDKRIKCLYGYAAEKTGNHAAALQIFGDCIERWNDVYSMIWLAQMYESGSGMPVDLAKSAELMRRGATQPDDAPYVSLARYHWGAALTEGRGVPADPLEGRRWLEKSAAAGESEAISYLQHLATDAAAPRQ